MDYAQQAIALDPGYALGYGALAYAYNRFGLGAYETAGDPYLNSKAAIAKALEIDDELADVHTEAAWVRMFYDSDWDGAKESLDRALEIEPDNGRAHGNYALWMLHMSRHRESLDYARRAQELDPLSPAFTTLVGITLAASGDYEAAATEFRNAIELEPDYFYARKILVNVYVVEGRSEEAVEVARDYAEGAATSSARLFLGLTYALVDRSDESRAVLGDESPRLFFTPELAAARGDGDAVFAAVGSLRERYPGYGTQFKILPLLFRFRDDPRYAELMRDMGLPE